MDPENAEFLRLLVASGWHQARVARELGVSTGTVSRYVSGAIKPSVPVLRLFADVLQEPLLISGKAGDVGPGESGGLRDGPRWLEDWESEVVRVLRRIEPGSRKRVIDALREIVEVCAGQVRYSSREARQKGSSKIPTTAEIIMASAQSMAPAKKAPRKAPPTALPPDAPAGPREERPHSSAS